jgi:GMP synthase (glutamine-hydrolysing)
MSHGDSVLSMPKNFRIVGSSKTVKYAFVTDEKNKQYGLQFHPEVEHTEFGITILKNFLSICNLKIQKKLYDLGSIEAQIREQVGTSYAIGAVSGGVDSTVAAALVARAIGNKFIPIYVENGLMREGTADQIKKIFKHIGIKPDIVECEEEMLNLLKGVESPEGKRKIIGNFYIEVFEREMKKLIKSGKDVKFLVQGTIYSDVIESKGSKHASKIKSHHNVGGLPEKMKLKVVEPLREFYKDEVREIGRMLELPEEFVGRQPFPGPGYAIRVRGEVTQDRLHKERQADTIVLEELEKAGLLDQVFQSFPIMSGAYSTAVKGDGSFFGEVVALRIIDSRDIMTAKWSELPYSVLQNISSRIVNEVPEISRVVYDITTKPPATMEWE